MSENSDNSYPMPDENDSLHKMAKTGIGITSEAISLITFIPGLSVLATALFSQAIIPPVEKRRVEFMNDIAKRLNELEYNFENLSKNPSFVTAILQGTQLAIRNHDNLKLEALRNAVINMAKPLYADEDMFLMFLSWIDNFQKWHLRILSFIHSQKLATVSPAGTLLDQLREFFPGDVIDLELLNQMIKELENSGLLVSDLLSSTDEGAAVVKAHLTGLGEKYLDFITK
jgi:hypothetical protein